MMNISLPFKPKDTLSLFPSRTDGSCLSFRFNTLLPYLRDLEKPNYSQSFFPSQFMSTELMVEILSGSW